ncbi:hypothetical protein [Wolbachia endosymbiont of Pentidionis agamae]|uniref:hypothetical protein n=1 Tax=Wolbachia endosymbiont of Pentidionis agamae TaxID=3110435 RepID=UPI002FD00D8D
MILWLSLLLDNLSYVGNPWNAENSHNCRTEKQRMYLTQRNKSKVPVSQRVVVKNVIGLLIADCYQNMRKLLGFRFNLLQEFTIWI